MEIRIFIIFENRKKDEKVPENAATVDRITKPNVSDEYSMVNRPP